MTIWQQRWDSELRGRWTARLIPRLSAWVDRQHGEVDFYLMQFLTGHGLFRAYRHKIGKVLNPSCVYCGDTNDDADHTFFQCDRWAAPRPTLEIEVGQLIPENIIEVVLDSTSCDEWRWVPTKNNVANDATRDTEHIVVAASNQWFTRSEFLLLREEN